jgi:two-component system, NtrC family, nitrogen regulation sensor histidine kinase NtrY
MDLRDQLHRHRKDGRLIFGGLALLLLVLTGAFYFLQRSRELPTFLVDNRVVLFALWYVDVVLILALVFVLLRNLFKVLVERHHRILGSKFKTKLVVTFIGLSLIPVLLLFVIATELLEGSVDRWFATPVHDVLAQGNAVAQELIGRIERNARRDAGRVLVDVEGIDLDDARRRPELQRRLQAHLSEMELALLAVYDGTDFVQAVVDPEAGIADLPETPRDLLAEALEKGTATRLPPGRDFPGRLILAAAAAPPPATPAPTGGRSRRPPPRPVVVAGVLLEPGVADQARKLIDAYVGYRQLEVQREDIKASHLLTFLTVTLLILFASSWVGLYLARRVTVPIQALAEGTRRVADGDLDHRVEVGADDELGVLVESFNRMTQELKRNKEVIEQSNRDLLEANARLAEERALIAAVLENVAAGVLSVDAAGGIFTCNGAALNMLRQSHEELIGRPVAEVWSDPERSKLARLLDGEPPPGRAAQEVQLVLGGEWKTFEVKVTAMRDAAGRPGGRVVVLEDLTELIKAQSLAAWNEAARRIAHEIKNPLTPIKLSAERLLRKYRQGDADLGAALEEGAELITREVGTMQRMVDEFSRYARMPRPKPAPVDLARLVEDTLHLYRDIKPGVVVESEVDAAVAEAWIDAEQVKQVLINLLDNAIDATEAPGRVRVSAQRADGHLEIHVADSGRGIPAAAREKLFLPHFSTKGRGTGLGLAIVYRIVTDHHGTIRVEENRPHGTVFTIELPG